MGINKTLQLTVFGCVQLEHVAILPFKAKILISPHSCAIYPSNLLLYKLWPLMCKTNVKMHLKM